MKILENYRKGLYVRITIKNLEKTPFPKFPFKLKKFEERRIRGDFEIVELHTILLNEKDLWPYELELIKIRRFLKKLETKFDIKILQEPIVYASCKFLLDIPIKSKIETYLWAMKPKTKLEKEKLEGKIEFNTLELVGAIITDFSIISRFKVEGFIKITQEEIEELENELKAKIIKAKFPNELISNLKNISKLLNDECISIQNSTKPLKFRI